MLRRRLSGERSAEGGPGNLSVSHAVIYGRDVLLTKSEVVVDRDHRAADGVFDGEDDIFGYLDKLAQPSAVGACAESGADLLPSRPKIADLFG